jgi:alkanesulfonate monooxygenase SsuD/methylene tetrahydromethanopterin reductase-like flavin-dependent oxidoreductase (luciferase family)
MEGGDRRFWGGVAPIQGARIPRLAARLEAEGRYGVMAGQGWGPPWIPLAAAAAATERLQLLSSIAIAGARSPFETAFAAMDLDRLSGGRFILGLGSSTRRITDGYYGNEIDRPVAHLRETVEAVRMLIAHAHEGLEPFHGRWYRAEFEGFDPTPPPLRTDLPIWLGALRGVMTRLAGEIADGVIGHPLWGVEWWLGRIQEDLRAGAQRGNRPVDAIHQCAYVTTAISDDRAEALADARRFVAAYAAFEQYASFFEDQGYGGEAAAIRDRWACDDREGAAKLVGEAMARSFVVYGDADFVRSEVERVWAVADSMIVSAPVWGLPMDRIGAYSAAVEETFFEKD